MSETQQARTRLFAQALGPFLILVALMVFQHYETLPLLLPAFRQDAPLMMVTGTFTVCAGMFLLAAHHHFGSPAAIGVTVLAIIFVLRGAMVMLAPDVVLGMATQVARNPLILLGFTTIALLVGAWLTFVGWFSKTL